MHKITTAALMAGVCSLVAHEANAACWKWNNNLSHCDVDPTFCGSTVVPTDQQLESYYGYLYADTAADSCQKWGQALYGLNGQVYTNAAGAKQCWTDGDNFNYQPNGVLDSFDPISPVIAFMEIPRESCCEATLEGFHELTPDKWYITNAAGAVVALNPLAGEKFTFETVGTHPSQISLIRADNYAGARGAYVSDLYRPGVPTALKNAEQCGGTLQLSNTNMNCRPEVDHIIPRKDIKGCDCGKNSSKNAQVISRGLNGYLKNYCGNSPQGLLRQQMIAYYSTNPVGFTRHVPIPTYASMAPEFRNATRGSSTDFAQLFGRHVDHANVPEMAFFGVASSTDAPRNMWWLTTERAL